MFLPCSSFATQLGGKSGLEPLPAPLFFPLPLFLGRLGDRDRSGLGLSAGFG